MFKKRTIKGNIRKHEKDDEEDVSLKAIKDLKEEQLLRKTFQKTETTAIIPNETSKKIKKDGISQRSIESMIVNQFASNSGNTVTIHSAHEAIMEKYIDEKIGKLINERQNDVANELNCDIVSDNLQTMSDQTLPVISSEEVGSLGVGTGIAEVVLPIAFRLKNIETTELARKKLEEDKLKDKIHRQDLNVDTQYKLDSSHYRFQKTSHSSVIPGFQHREIKQAQSKQNNHKTETDNIQNYPISLSAKIMNGHDVPNQAQRHQHHQHQHDDAMVERFKKNQRNGRR